MMLVRALLLLAVATVLDAGAKPAPRHFKIRPLLGKEIYDDAKPKKACGVDVTPDFIERCFYTDCFKKTSGYLAGRRRLGGAMMADTPDCDIKPKYKQPLSQPGTYNAAGYDVETSCKPGDYIKAKEDDYTKGKHVCHYRHPMPKDGNSECYCRTMVCIVITKTDTVWTKPKTLPLKETERPIWEDDRVVEGSSKQGKDLDDTSCNFIVRIEDAHGSPKVQPIVAAYLFSIAAGIAILTSVIFMIRYGSEEEEGHGHGHGGHGHGGHGDGEKKHGHGAEE